MPYVPINAVTSRGWPHIYPNARQLRVLQDLDTEDEAFTIALDMPGGEVRYLINNRDQLRVMDSIRLASFLRMHTSETSFVLTVNPTKIAASRK